MGSTMSIAPLAAGGAGLALGSVVGYLNTAAADEQVADPQLEAKELVATGVLAYLGFAAGAVAVGGMGRVSPAAMLGGAAFFGSAALTDAMLD